MQRKFSHGREFNFDTAKNIAAKKLNTYSRSIVVYNFNFCCTPDSSIHTSCYVLLLVVGN